MMTIALRFAENFAPECGTIAAHEKVISSIGHVWYGKLGPAVSTYTSEQILNMDDPAILLIHSGADDRWWAYVSNIQRAIPPLDEIPTYYRNKASDFGCWFKVSRFEKAENNIVSRCTVISSGKTLTEASRQSMSPYFIIDYCPQNKSRDSQKYL